MKGGSNTGICDEKTGEKNGPAAFAPADREDITPDRAP